MVIIDNLNLLLSKKDFEYLSRNLYVKLIKCKSGKKIRIFIDTGDNEINIYSRNKVLNVECYNEYTSSLAKELEKFGMVKIH